MSTVTFTLRRRDLAWATALIVLLTSVWVSRGDLAEAGAPEGRGIARVYVASGGNFPDALGVGPAAALHGAPIILVPTNPPLDNSTSAELVSLDPKTVIIIGGTAAVSQATENDIVALLPNADVSRISGTNRYKTNAALIGVTFPVEGWAAVPAAAFTAPNPDINDVSISSYILNDSGGTLYAPIQLPHGAEILELKARGFDESTGVMTVALVREGLLAATIATVSTNTASGATTISTLAIVADTEVVDNELYAYYIQVTGTDLDAGGSRYLRTVMVRYQLGVSSG